MISCSSSDQYAYACSMPSGMTLGSPGPLEVSQRAWLDPACRHPDRVLLHHGLPQTGAGWPPPTRPTANPGMSYRLFLVPGQQGRDGSGGSCHAVKTGSRERCRPDGTTGVAVAERGRRSRGMIHRRAPALAQPGHSPVRGRPKAPGQSKARDRYRGDRPGRLNATGRTSRPSWRISRGPADISSRGGR